MTQKELKKRVDKIISMADDDEMAHSEEDELYLELLTQYLPAGHIGEIVGLQKADFARWCA